MIDLPIATQLPLMAELARLREQVMALSIHLEELTSALEKAGHLHITKGLLTPRERHVLALLGHGYCNKTIANKLGISHFTVSMHLKALYNKFPGTNRIALALRAKELLEANR